jgi:iron complex outermembrane receptor protein
MSKTSLFGGGSALAAAFALGFGAMPAQAQQTPAAAPAAKKAAADEIVVTGSYIRGTPEDAALPVNVLTAADLEKQGSPTTVELIKLLAVSSGVQGDTNQFDSRAQGAEGSGTVNLRGLGPERTLVLLNGRRLPLNPFGLVGTTVDTNMIPSAAIGRIEVLKDGAASTYGSDAVAGVVNFITKTNFRGLELGGDYKSIDGSDGNWTASASLGWQGDKARGLVSFGSQHKSELGSISRDWATRSYLENPQGGWSAFGNPSSYLPVGATGTPVAGVTRDPQCNAVGATAGFSGATPVCFFNFVRFDNLIEQEDRYQVFSSFDLDYAPKHSFHFEALYGNTVTPEWKTSPSYITLQSPTAPVGTSYVVPATNPFYQDFVAKNPGVFPASTAAVSLIVHRPLGWGGNPLYRDNFGSASQGKRAFDLFRVSTGLKGEWNNGVGYDVSVTYGEETGIRTGFDVLTNRFARALQGLGGPNCSTPTPGANGCLWWNPFSTRIQTNAITGQTNAQYNPATAASDAVLLAWMWGPLRTEQTGTSLVVDAVLNGEMPISLPGGKIGWAAGAQMRSQGFKSNFSTLSDGTRTPCVGSIPDNITGTVNNVCPSVTGPFIFLGVGFPADVTRDVNAAFAEFNLPFTDKLNFQLAARYEDYGGATGSTFNPKIAGKWQIVDGFALRGSAGSTFRGPSLSNIQPGSVTAFNSVLGAFRAVDIFGNPNLKPEKADTYNVGALINAGGLKVSLDYWRYKFRQQIISEPTESIANTMFPAGQPINCGNPAFAPVQSRFTFTGGVCSATAISRIRVGATNGPDVDTQGFDLSTSYELSDVFGGDLTFGLDGTYTQNYKIAAFSIGGVTVQQPFDAVGKLNAGLANYPLPQYKGTFSTSYEHGRHSLRYALNFVDSYVDQRTAPFATSQSFSLVQGVPGTLPQGKTISAQQTHDITYRADLPGQMTFVLSAENVTDKDPAFARLDLSYDPFTGNPLGRTFKVGLKKKFGGS